MARIENPLHPERVCWGCSEYCRADDLACGNGSIRTPHPRELFGDDWADQKDDTASSVNPERVPKTDS